jgi:hypothetical protein
LEPATNKSLSAWGVAAIALTAVVLISPSFFFGQVSGQDFDFHVDSWLEVSHQWHEGVAFPGWAAGANNGYGEPRFIFYPPVSWLVGAALGQAFPWKIVPEVFLFLTLLFAGISMHRLARSWLSQEAAIAAALIYMSAPYQLVDIYVRSAFSELLAGAILPLAVLCVLNCARNETLDANASRRARWRNIALLSIVYAGIWLTNAPTAVVASYALAFMLIVLAIHRRSFAPLWTGGAGLALGLTLASVYIVPAVFEQRWVNIEEAISQPLVFSNSFIFKRVADPRHSPFNLMISAMATLEIAIAFAAAMILRKRNEKLGEAWVALVALCVFSTAIMLPLTGSVLQFLPEMRFIQFPWRWLIVLGIGFSFFLSGAIFISRRRLAASLAYLMIIAATAAALWTFFPRWDRGATIVAGAVTAIETGAGYDGMIEYRPRFGEEIDLPVDAPLIYLMPAGTEEVSKAPPQSIGATVSVESWSGQKKVFTVASSVPAVAAVHLLNYPAWQVRLNGQPATLEADPVSGQMLLALPSGASRVEIRFGWTRDRTAGCVLSGAGILILLWIVILGWRPTSPHPR